MNLTKAIAGLCLAAAVAAPMAHCWGGSKAESSGDCRVMFSPGEE